MKLSEFLTVLKQDQGTTSCGTTSSGQKATSPQHIVSQDLVPETMNGHIVEHEDHSATAEGVSQNLRRVAGKGLKTGFRCTSGRRKRRTANKQTK